MKDKLKQIGLKIGKLSPYVAIILSFVIFLASIFTDRDKPKVFELSPNQVNRTLTSTQLASWFLENKRDFEVLDMRKVEKYKEEHIKNSISCPACHVSKQDAKKKMQESDVVPDFRKKIVIYTQTGEKPVHLPRILARNKNVYFLQGGFDEWKSKILTLKEYKETDTQDVLLEKQKMNAITNYFLGNIEIKVPERVPIKVPVRKHIGSKKADEGC